MTPPRRPKGVGGKSILPPAEAGGMSSTDSVARGREVLLSVAKLRADLERIREQYRYDTPQVMQELESMTAALASAARALSPWTEQRTSLARLEVRANMLLGLSAERLGRKAEAHAAFERAVEVFEGFPPGAWRTAQSFSDYGVALLKLGNLERAH